MSLNTHKFNPITALSVLLMTLVTHPVYAEVDNEKFELGKQKAKVCMTCHGEDGISTQDPYPNLRGQKVGYLISSLKITRPEKEPAVWRYLCSNKPIRFQTKISVTFPISIQCLVTTQARLTIQIKSAVQNP